MKIVVFLIYGLLLLVTTYGMSNKRYATKAVNTSILIMFLLSIFKDGTQIPDFHVYKDSFNLSVNGGSILSMEISFSLISRLFGFFDSAGFYFVLAFYSAIFLYSFRKIILKYGQIAPSIILIFYSNAFLVFGLVQIRAGAAIGLVYLIIHSLKGNYKRFFAWIFSIFLHTSSLIFIPLGILSKKVFNKKTILILLLLSFVVTPLVIPILEFIVGLIPVPYIQQKILTYILEERAKNLSLNFLGPNFILRSILLFLFLKFSKIYNSERDRILLNIYIMGYLVYIALSSAPEIAFRIANSLFIAEIFLLPLLFSRFKQKEFSYPTIALYSLLQLTVNVFFTTYFNYTQG